MSGPDRTALAVALGEPLASLVLDGDARLEPVPVPGMAAVAVWSVVADLGPHPVGAHVGVWPDGSARVLSADQRAWAELVAAVGVTLEDPEQARAYVVAFLEITRGSMVVVQPVASLDELRWRPGSESEEEAKRRLQARPPDLSPVALRRGEGFHVEQALVVDQRLQRNTFEVGVHGEIDASFDVVAEGLPLPIAR